jgi:hypothetical protein
MGKRQYQAKFGLLWRDGVQAVLGTTLAKILYKAQQAGYEIYFEPGTLFITGSSAQGLHNLFRTTVPTDLVRMWRKQGVLVIKVVGDKPFVLPSG